MCLARRRNFRDADPKTRRIWVCGNLCLIVGISMTLFASSWRALRPDVFDALHGFLIGAAITFQIWSLRRMRRSDSCA
jgi:hypothetical protein